MRVATSETEIIEREWVFSRKVQVLTACAVFFLLYVLTTSSPAALVAEQSQTIYFLANDGCSCTHKNVTYGFCYHLPKNWTIKGRRFNCNSSSHLEKLGLLSKAKVIDLMTEKMPTPMFVSAMSENHFMEGLNMIANIRSLWPRQRIIIYDLGLNPKTKRKLQEKCLVEVRRFPFETYPPYVRQLKQFRWKPLIIAMMLKEFGALWYMDTSVRWRTDCRDSVYSDITCRSGLNTTFARLSLPTAPNNANCTKPAYMLHLPAHHGIFPATHPGMYKYIPTDIDAIKKKSAMVYNAGFAFIVRTAEAIELLKWYVLCALEDECMAPHGAKQWCNFKNDPFNRYAGCHRY
ncbi:unnamed protein product [Cylicocyclus nassatus]|uniref:Uncharacterized protein n=1 Tax=Cylicocyclus nassatus TaxID=53992 RepID=A0AA36DTT0_CYLNA|nr:unnamed protein product [Cylicocyclus nassatus]